MELEDYVVGMIVSGIVSRVTDAFAAVDLGEGWDGLIQRDEEWPPAVGQKIEARVVSRVDPRAGYVPLIRVIRVAE